MKALIKNIIYKTISQLRLPQLMHKSIAGNDLTIITYHGIIDKPLKIFDWCFLDKDSFRDQVGYLKKHFNVVQLSNAIELIINGKLKGSTAVITFDDGFQNNYDVAYPILNDAGVPATIFLTTGYVDTEDTIWYWSLNLAVNRTLKRELHWNGHYFDIENNEKKNIASAKLQLELKALPNFRLIEKVKSIITQLGENPDEPFGVDSPYRMLCSGAIKEMVGSGLIEFGAHTHTHAILSKLSLKDKEKEIKKSVEMIEKIINTPCKIFAYPNGGVDDFDNETVSILESFGINAAVSLIPGPNFSDTPLMYLRRYGISGDTSIERFQTIVHHLRWKYKKF